MDALVSGVSLGKSPEVDAPQVNIQYAVLEVDAEHHELVEKLHFVRTKKGTMAKSDFLAWEEESERLRDEALSEYDRAKTEVEKAAIAERLREELNRQ